MDEDHKKIVPLPIAMNKTSSQSVVAKAILRLRRHRRMSQRHLADALGVGEDVIRRIEIGEQQVSSNQLNSLANLFKVNLTAFFLDETLSAGDNLTEVERLRAECIALLKYIDDPNGLQVVKEALSKMVT